MIGNIRNITGPARAALAAFALLLGRRADSAGQGFDSCVHGRCGRPCLGPWSVHHVGGHTQDRVLGQAVDL